MIATLFYNPSVAYGDSPAGPAPPLSAMRTFPPLTGESALREGAEIATPVTSVTGPQKRTAVTDRRGRRSLQRIEMTQAINRNLKCLCASYFWVAFRLYICYNFQQIERKKMSSMQHVHLTRATGFIKKNV